MDYSKFIVSNQKEESISIQRVNKYNMRFGWSISYFRGHRLEFQNQFILILVFDPDDFLIIKNAGNQFILILVFDPDDFLIIKNAGPTEMLQNALSNSILIISVIISLFKKV